MVPPKQEARIRYIERKIICEVCGSECIGRQIIESRYMNEDLIKDRNFSVRCTRCKTEVCLECWDDSLCCKKKEKEKEKNRKKTEPSSSYDYIKIFLLFVVVLILGYVLFSKFSNSNVNYKDLEAIIRDEYHNLRNKFPEQNVELWQNVQRVMHNSDSVTSLIFLYKDNPKTSDCLAEEIAYSYSKIQNRTFSRESIFHADNRVDDFGKVLEEYGLKVEKTNLLIVKHLHEVSGNVARIFHTLCDSFTPKVAPSVYIFTMRYDDSVKNLKPIAKAAAVLREAWSDLSEKELPALISRVVTNVVEIESENTKHC